MSAFNTARIIRVKYNFICEMCKKNKSGKLFQYKSYSYVSRYKSPLLEVCEDCIYKEIYGGKFWRRKKKQKTLE